MAGKHLSPQQQEALLEKLKDRFESNMDRHRGFEWLALQVRLESDSEKLWSLHEMEASGGEPDVVGYDAEASVFVFFDCSAETPAGRRNLCYDDEALEARKKNKPEGSALGRAAEMGIEVLTEEQYRHLQRLGAFDTKTSSWIITPDDIRKRGGALFCDRRYDHVFTYHNGADSYYSVRGFRGSLQV